MQSLKRDGNGLHERQSDIKRRGLLERLSIRKVAEQNSCIDEARTMWRDMDRSFYGTIGFVQRAYISTNKISYILVGMGLVLFGASIYFTFEKGGMSELSVITGGMSLSSIVSIFFTNQQKRISETAAKALGNLAQIQMIYKLYSLQFAQAADSARNDPANFPARIERLKKSTIQYIFLVQDAIENDSCEGSGDAASGSTTSTTKSG